MSDTTEQPVPTQTEAAQLARELLDLGIKKKEIAAAEKSKKESLIRYFENTEERTVGPLLAYTSTTKTYDLITTGKAYDQAECIEALTEIEGFQSFVGRRVNGEKVLNAADADKRFFATLETRGLIEKVIDRKAACEAALEDTALRKALKANHLKAELSEKVGWRFKNA